MSATTQMNGQEERSRAMSASERKVAELWNEVLEKSDERRAADNFFELGGDSIAMATLLFRIQEEFSVNLPAEALFRAPTLAELSAMIDARA